MTNPTFALTESNLSLISQTLVLASSRYVEFAADAETLRGREPVAKQFRIQAIEARQFAILIGDGDAAVTINGDADAAHEAARRIVAQQANRRLKRKTWAQKSELRGGQ